MGRVVAVANQKGGVAKTTTTHSLGAGLAELGERVLLVDLDPQACLPYSLGIDSDWLDRSGHDVLAGRAEAADVLVKSGDLTALPSTIDLAGAEVHLMTRTGREHVLARALGPLVGEYDTVLIDCPPSLGVLTINGLTAAGAGIGPLQCETLGHRGVRQLLETIGDARRGPAAGGEPIPKSVRFAEAPGKGRSILPPAPRSAGAEASRAIARILHQ